MLEHSTQQTAWKGWGRHETEGSHQVSAVCGVSGFWFLETKSHVKKRHFPSHASHTLSSFPASTRRGRWLRTGVLLDMGARKWKTELMGWECGPDGNSRESNFQAMVMPPISESLKRSRKVPSGLLMSRSWACCLFTKPKMALGVWFIWCHCWVGRHHS